VRSLAETPPLSDLASVHIHVNPSDRPLHQLVLQEFVDQSQHTPIDLSGLHGTLPLELLTDLLQSQLLFEALPGPRAGAIKTMVGGALQLEEDLVAVLHERIDHLSAWVHRLMHCYRWASLRWVWRGLQPKDAGGGR